MVHLVGAGSLWVLVNQPPQPQVLTKRPDQGSRADQGFPHVRNPIQLKCLESTMVTNAYYNVPRKVMP
jgi:hypothetical protein